MTHKDPRIQELIELLHGALRSLCDRKIEYDVREFGSYHVIVVLIGDERYQEMTISDEILHNFRWWDDAKRNIVRSFMINWFEKTPAPVRPDDITYIARLESATKGL